MCRVYNLGNRDPENQNYLPGWTAQLRTIAVLNPRVLKIEYVTEKS